MFGLIASLLVFGVPVLAIFYFALRLLHAVERRPRDRIEGDQTKERLNRLEQQVALLFEQMDRVVKSQEVTLKLLASASDEGPIDNPK
ncbi:MAG: hypothetical protein HY059_05700 [Proteobacteria bacterium]|nr:hypothetical protein [Pseudomonadota bacterium]